MSEEVFQSKDIFFIFTGLFTLVLIMIFLLMSPEQTERTNNWENEKSWINTASCQELKSYILFDLENRPENSHFFVAKAKELHEWKCEK